MLGVDAFTEVLRISVWAVVGFLVLFAIGWPMCVLIIDKWGKRQRRQKSEDRLYDEFPKSHVGIIGEITGDCDEWMSTWT